MGCLSLLERTLELVDRPLLRERLPDGSIILLLPHGGRVLGLASAESHENFLWTHPALEAPGSAREFFATHNWHNSGGDRTWISPEIDLFFPNFPDMHVYRVPAALDGTDYETVNRGEKTALRSRFSLRSGRRNSVIEVEIEKVWSGANNPLRYDPLTSDLDYAGYKQSVTLHVLSGGGVSLWNLVQLPQGGEALVPVHGVVQPRSYFGAISSEDLISAPDVIRYRAVADGIQKIGISPLACTGRVGYIYRQNGGWALVIRVLFVNRAAEYLDMPWTPSGETLPPGDVLQICSVAGDLGQYVEVEHHGPAGASDVSTLWAFRGPLDAIQLAAERLLGFTGTLEPAA